MAYYPIGFDKCPICGKKVRENKEGNKNYCQGHMSPDWYGRK
jgi:hypothetical protein